MELATEVPENKPVMIDEYEPGELPELDEPIFTAYLGD